MWDGWKLVGVGVVLCVFGYEEQCGVVVSNVRTV